MFYLFVKQFKRFFVDYFPTECFFKFYFNNMHLEFSRKMEVSVIIIFANFVLTGQRVQVDNSVSFINLNLLFQSGQFVELTKNLFNHFFVNVILTFFLSLEWKIFFGVKIHVKLFRFHLHGPPVSR